MLLLQVFHVKACKLYSSGCNQQRPGPGLSQPCAAPVLLNAAAAGLWHHILSSGHITLPGQARPSVLFTREPLLRVLASCMASHVHCKALSQAKPPAQANLGPHLGLDVARVSAARLRLSAGGQQSQGSRPFPVSQATNPLPQRVTCCVACAAGSGHVAGQSTLITRWSAEPRQLASHMQLRMQRKASAGMACSAVATAQRLLMKICRVSAAAPAAHRTVMAPPCSTPLQTSLMWRSWLAPSRWVRFASVAQQGAHVRTSCCPGRSRTSLAALCSFASMLQASALRQGTFIIVCCACAMPPCCRQVGFLSKAVRVWSP